MASFPEYLLLNMFFKYIFSAYGNLERNQFLAKTNIIVRMFGKNMDVVYIQVWALHLFFKFWE